MASSSVGKLALLPLPAPFSPSPCSLSPPREGAHVSTRMEDITVWRLAVSVSRLYSLLPAPSPCSPSPCCLLPFSLSPCSRSPSPGESSCANTYSGYYCVAPSSMGKLGCKCVLMHEF